MATVIADLDDLLTALYVLADDFLPGRDRSRPGPKPKISDAEVICLAVAQVLLDCPKERRFIRFAKRRLGHLFPYIPGQSGYNKRVRELAPQIVTLLGSVARVSPSWCNGLRLVDATPVPCGQSRETVKRSEFAGHAAYGYCAAHSRHFWGFKLYLLAAADGMPFAFELAPANAPEREVVAELLERVELEGFTVIGDKGLSGTEIEQLVAVLGGAFLRPDRRDEAPRFGNLGGVRQWIEAIFDQLKDQLSPRAPRRPHNRRAVRAGRSTHARLRCRHLAQLDHRRARPQPDRLRPLIPGIGNHSSRRERAGSAGALATS